MGVGSGVLRSKIEEMVHMGQRAGCCDWQKSGCDKVLKMFDLTDSKGDLDMHRGQAVGRKW